MALVLGGFVFTDYAIPEKVTQGGEHNLVVHKLIGGARVIDAMGPDDMDLSWTGRFQGPNATNNAMMLNSMRIAGSQLPLIIDSQYYTVVIKTFHFDYERWYQIPYQITCCVAADAGGLGGLVSGLGSLVVGDLATAASYLGDL